MAEVKKMTVSSIVAIILAIIGLIFLIIGIWRNWKVRSIRSWPKTNAYVINSVAEPVNDQAGDVYVRASSIIPVVDSKAEYVPRVTYRYRIRNKDYISNNVVYSGKDKYNSYEINVLLGQIETGSTIPVYYDPNDHSESYIYYGDMSYGNITIGIIMLIIAALIFFKVSKKAKKLYNENVKNVKNDDDASYALTNIDKEINNNRNNPFA